MTNNVFRLIKIYFLPGFISNISISINFTGKIDALSQDFILIILVSSLFQS